MITTCCRGLQGRSGSHCVLPRLLALPEQQHGGLQELLAQQCAAPCPETHCLCWQGQDCSRNAGMQLPPLPFIRLRQSWSKEFWSREMQAVKSPDRCSFQSSSDRANYRLLQTSCRPEQTSCRPEQTSCRPESMLVTSMLLRYQLCVVAKHSTAMGLVLRSQNTMSGCLFA